jgi:hypothetical protein
MRNVNSVTQILCISNWNVNIAVQTRGSKGWTICKREESRITANEMKFLRRTAEYRRMDHKRNKDMEELNTE